MEKKIQELTSRIEGFETKLAELSEENRNLQVATDEANAKLATMEEMMLEEKEDPNAGVIEMLQAKQVEFQEEMAKLKTNVGTAPATAAVKKDAPKIPTSSFNVKGKEYKFRHATLTVKLEALGNSIKKVNTADLLKNKKALEEIAERFPTLLTTV